MSDPSSSAPSTEVTAADDAPPTDRERELQEIVGRTVSGRYRITKLIGTGGMGAVYEAEHTGIGKKVAVKFISRENARENTVASRFAREARAASAIESEHIVSVFDAGTDDGRPFIVMELLRGEDFGARLRRLGKIKPEDAVHVIAQVLRGLADAHDAGIIHRDLKPDNVFLVDRRGDPSFVKIVDFGVSKIDRPESGTARLALTQKGTVVGTPFYMAPEQAQAAPDLDARADLFSVGAMLFESLAGRPPHVGNTYEAVIVSICMNDAPDLRTLVPEVSPPLARFVMRALARDRKARFSSARQMLVALSEFAPREGRPSDAKAAPPTMATQLSGAPATAQTNFPNTQPSPQAPTDLQTSADAVAPRGTSTSWISADRISSAPSARVAPRSNRTLVITGIIATVTGGLATMVLARATRHPQPATTTIAPTTSAIPSGAVSSERLAPASAAPLASTSTPQLPPAALRDTAAPLTSAANKPKGAPASSSGNSSGGSPSKHGGKKSDDIDRDFP